MPQAAQAGFTSIDGFPLRGGVSVTISAIERTLVALSMMLGGCASQKSRQPASAGAESGGRCPPAAGVSAATVPSTSLARHDFFYAGEAKQRQMFIVRGGKIVWSYNDSGGRGEISDATLLSSGNILFAHQYAIELITPSQKVLWRYDAPPGTEVHTGVPIGVNHVLFVQNGDPAFVRVVNVNTGAIERQFDVQTKYPKQVHGQFRHARLTDRGTLLLAHMDMGKVIEYRADGTIVRSIDAPGVWGATPMRDGRMLIVAGNGSNGGVREIDAAGNAIWSLSRSDISNYRLGGLQLAWRLPDGNTILSSWVNQWSGPVDPKTAPIQAIEVTPDRKAICALHQYTNPNLGPATTIQILDQPEAPENVFFGDIR